MRTAVIALTLLAGTAAHAQRATEPPQQPTASTAASESAKHVDAGSALYKKKVCYECHVNDAQGGPQGPRLAPNPIPFPRFMTYIRNPTGYKPPFSEKELARQKLPHLYSFRQGCR